MSPESATDLILPEQASTLAGLFRERVRRTPEHVAYRFFDALNGTWADYSWAAMAREVDRWQAALAEEGLKPGDRVAIMARNSRFWVIFDQAALGLGIVVVPIYTEDRADNVAYMVNDAGIRMLLIGGPPQWERLAGKLKNCRSLRRIVSIAEIEESGDKRLMHLQHWLGRGQGEPRHAKVKPTDLATIVYTSGTTGRPKGVMLTHWNILSNAYSCLQIVPVATNHVFLSFLPLSHMLERTVGYYLPMMAGAIVAHARSILELANDLRLVRPDALISVPRIYERVYARLLEQLARKGPVARFLFNLAVDVGWHRHEVLQGRERRKPSLLLWPLLKRAVADKVTARLGGNLKVAISGGAALAPDIARVFIGLGVPVLQGYGLTETSPVVSANRLENNVPSSIGPPLPGVEVKVGDQDELLVRGESVMAGFWNNPEDTRRVLDAQGWLHTGDRARIEDGRIYLTGRLKEIIVLANGEKVPPMDMEIAITADAVFDQVIIIGEGRPYLAALVVLNEPHWQEVAREHDLSGIDVHDRRVEEILLERIAACLHDFPGYAQVIRVTCLLEPWSVDNGLLTPTLKVRRAAVQQKCGAEIERMYEKTGARP
ncbi:MAG: long-chain fatty acid--CoA ligase [Gammaproteobacteria bacterium]|nr:long-chain fatty acid--CoA ligase [Gammaproteobacteria bacterium]